MVRRAALLVAAQRRPSNAADLVLAERAAG